MAAGSTGFGIGVIPAAGGFGISASIASKSFGIGEKFKDIFIGLMTKSINYINWLRNKPEIEYQSMKGILGSSTSKWLCI
jgi:hypothetical protein